MIGYHRVKSDELEQILAEGIKQTAEGKTDRNPDIVRTDEFLDTVMPEKLHEAGLSRKRNLYLYYEVDGLALDVFDGQLRRPDDIVKNDGDKTVAVELQLNQCFVSNLDLYDAVMTALKTEAPEKVEVLARQYWDQVYPLVDGYKPLANERIEIMVTYDVPPDSIRVLE